MHVSRFAINSSFSGTTVVKNRRRDQYVTRHILSCEASDILSKKRFFFVLTYAHDLVHIFHHNNLLNTWMTSRSALEGCHFRSIYGIPKRQNSPGYTYLHSALSRTKTFLITLENLPILEVYRAIKYSSNSK